MTGAAGGLAEAGGNNNLDLEIQAVTFNNGGALSLNFVDLCITGDIDLTPLDAADITFSGPVTLAVAAGGTLTLSVEQAEAFALAGLTITGEGTLAIVGDADDAAFGTLLGTGTVDMSGTTITAGDASGAVDYAAIGATDKAGDAITQTIIGSAFNDAVTISAPNDGDTSTIEVITQLGTDSGDIGVPGETPSANTPTDATPEVAGDQIIKPVANTIQIEVDAGYDQTDFINDGDIIQVASGAEFYAETVGAGDIFTATSDTTNDGVAVIELDGSADQTIDMSDAGGANGWTLIGAANVAGSSSTLIGSDQDDVIVDGAADGGSNAGADDTMTGNGGEDLFQFNVATTTPAEFTPNAIQAASDVEYILMDLAGGVNDPAALLTIEYQLNNVTTVAVVSDATAPGGAFDFSNNTELAAAVAAVMDAIPGISATIDGVTPTQINLVGDNGNLLNINSVEANAAGGGGTLDLTAEDTQDDDADNTNDAADTGDDDLQITDSMITGTVTAGEVYFLTVTLRDGSEIQAQFEAGSEFTTDAAGVVMGLMANSAGTGINDIAAGAVVASISPADGTGATIRITDGDDDDGGFELTVSEGQAILSASSGSSILPVAGGGGELLADQDADVITDFLDDDDTITFGLDAGSNDNYDEAANEATFADALAAAHAAFAADADLIYYLTGSDDATDGGPTGLLFVNANGDDEADTVVALTGVTEANFDDSNIV